MSSEHCPLDHTATLLPSGKVLVAGGYGSSGYLTSAEVYDPIANTWTTIASLNAARGSHGDAAAERQGARRRRLQWCLSHQRGGV